jgi:hypothetical protein
MSLVHRQINTLLETNESNNNINDSINLPVKHLLKCESCLWKITFYESTGSSIHLNGEKMKCPVCKEREIKSPLPRIIS